jgi:IS1 family transposase
MNTLPVETQVQILTALVEGNSLRSTARMTGAAKRTVSSLLRDMGAHCKNYHDRSVVGVEAKRVQADEIWSFVGCKQKNLKKGDQGRGDCWTWTALDQDSKLLISYRLGARGIEDGMAFLTDLRDRLATRVQLSTDGYHIYFKAVRKAFGWHQVDYAMIQKIYGKTAVDSDPARRYSPGKCIGIETRVVMGDPNPEDICTSHVERQNLNMRMAMRRFTRLTNAFSKKVECHLYAVALHTMYYNYCRPHMTLTKARGGIRTTPAMAAGLADRPWSVTDLLNLMLHPE